MQRCLARSLLVIGLDGGARIVVRVDKKSRGAWVGGMDRLGHVRFYRVQQCTRGFHSRSYAGYHVPYFPFSPYVKTRPFSLVWMRLSGDSCRFTFHGANITRLAVASI
jgi:hypothetical protein